MNLLEVKNLSYCPNDKKDVKILSDISFKVNKGTILGIAGESGSGKTTLGLILAGVLVASSGKILVNGTVTKNLIDNSDIQILLQNKGELVNPYRRVNAVLKEAFELKGSKSESDNAIADMLKKLKLKEDILNRKGYELSGGEQQRIAFARIMAVKPKILILDEPFSAQDIDSELILIQILKELNSSEGLSIVCISHDLRLLRLFTHELVILKDGLIIESGPTKEVLTSPANDQTKFLLDAENYNLSREQILKTGKS
jgi:ABC-type dipeptide/oligopeptide/nickel transport system ATPase subunit